MQLAFAGQGVTSKPSGHTALEASAWGLLIEAQWQLFNSDSGKLSSSKAGLGAAYVAVHLWSLLEDRLLPHNAAVGALLCHGSNSLQVKHHCLHALPHPPQVQHCCRC